VVLQTKDHALFPGIFGGGLEHFDDPAGGVLRGNTFGNTSATI
jgi:hypothetical protein